MEHNFNILLAEDDENDVFLLKLAFEQAGVRNRLIVTRDGEEAIDYLAGNGKYANRTEFPLPCFLILDLKMPRQSGMDVLRWLRQQPALNCLPVIILSSSAHRYDVERAYRLGANAFVTKPAGNDERLQLVQMIKGFWLTFNQPPILCTEGVEAALKIHAIEQIPTGL
jgi:CheY-like chemotaxis protein